VLLEHQSTVNPNLPLRLLLYIARLCEKTLFHLPRAVFFALYNGREEFPDSMKLKFADGSSLGIAAKETLNL